jgi:hypothetical protein
VLGGGQDVLSEISQVECPKQRKSSSLSFFEADIYGSLKKRLFLALQQRAPESTVATGWARWDLMVPAPAVWRAQVTDISAVVWL